MIYVHFYSFNSEKSFILHFLMETIDITRRKMVFTVIN